MQLETADRLQAVESHVDAAGFTLVRGLGGHGYGRRLHGPPFISNVVPRRPGVARCIPDIRTGSPRRR